MLDESTVAVGIFAEDRIDAAIVFTGERRPGRPVPPAAPAAPAFAPLAPADPARVDARRMNLLRDVRWASASSSGRTRMTVRELLALAPGTIVELDKAAGAPVDLLVNGTLMARGEVVVIDEEFARPHLRDRLAGPGRPARRMTPLDVHGGRRARHG